MKKNIILAVASTLLIACGGGGGGHNADDGGFQQPIKPELNVSFSPNPILPNPTSGRYESVPTGARAIFDVYARQGNTPIENGNEELLLSINDAIGTVSGSIYCYQADICTEDVKNANGDTIKVLKRFIGVQLDLAAGRGHFAVVADNGRVGEIGLNITVEGPNGSRVSKDILIPVRYPSSGEPYQVNIISPSKIAPNTATDITISVTDEAGNPVSNPISDNLIVTANNLPNTTLGFKGLAGQSVNAKTDTGNATISVLPRDEGYLTIVAQADSVDNDVSDGFQSIITAAKSIQVTSAYIPPTQNIIITTGALPNGLVGLPYEFTMATTGSSPINFVLTAGSLPPGISFANGVLKGTPTLAGAYNFSVQATGANGSTATKELTLTIAAGGFTFSRQSFESIEVTRELDPAKPDVCSAQGQILSLVAGDNYTLAPPFSWYMDAAGVKTALGAANNATRVVTANGVDLPNLDFTVTNDTTQVTLNGIVCPNAPNDVFNGHAIVLSAKDANGITFESVLPLAIVRKVVPASDNNSGGGSTNACNGFSPEPPGCFVAPSLTAKVGTAFTTTVAGATATSTVTNGSLPPGISQSGAILSGTPTKEGTYKFVLSNGTTSQAVTIIVTN